MSLLSDTVERVLHRLVSEDAVEIAPGREAAVLDHCVQPLQETSWWTPWPRRF